MGAGFGRWEARGFLAKGGVAGEGPLGWSPTPAGPQGGTRSRGPSVPTVRPPGRGKSRAVCRVLGEEMFGGRRSGKHEVLGLAGKGLRTWWAHTPMGRVGPCGGAGGGAREGGEGAPGGALGEGGGACTRGRANRTPESLPLQGSSTKVPGRRLGGDRASRLNEVLVWARGQSGELRIKGLNSSAF